MKSTRGSQIQVENGNLSIPAAEEMIEDVLNELAFTQDPGMVRAWEGLGQAQEALGLVDEARKTYEALRWSSSFTASPRARCLRGSNSRERA